MHIAILLYNKLLIHESVNTVLQYRIRCYQLFNFLLRFTFAPMLFGLVISIFLGFLLTKLFFEGGNPCLQFLDLRLVFQIQLDEFPLSCHAIAAFITRRKKSEMSFSCLVPASGNFTWATFFYKYS